jgi:hypothetical protein
MKSSMLKFWPLFFLLSLVEGGISFASLALIPADERKAVLFGFSPTRLVMLFALLAALVVLVILFFYSWRRPDWRVRWLNPERYERLYLILNVAAAVGMLAVGAGMFFLRYYDPERTMALFVRAQPLLVFAFLFCAEAMFWLLVLRKGVHAEAWGERKKVWIIALFIFAALLTVWGLIALTGLGIRPDEVYPSVPGVPLLGWQVVVAILGGWLALMIGLRGWFDKNPRLADLILAVMIWGIAVAVWMSVPLSVLRTSFYAPIPDGSIQPFPYSDAGFYDSLARGLLLGLGFIQQIPPRPLFIVFLAGLDWLFGGDYGKVVLGQTLVIALLPVVLYFLGKRLHSRPAGVLVALLVIFRELTSLWVSSTATVSNSKMLLSDLPTCLAIAAFLLFIVSLFSDKKPSTLKIFFAGGIFGLLLLLRTQSLFLLLALLVAGLSALRSSWKRWLASAAVFMAGFALGLCPWIVRNWIVTGAPALDDPMQFRAAASMYLNATTDYWATDVGTASAGEASKQVVRFIFQHPGYVGGFITNQFITNEVDTLLVLPLAEPYNGIRAPVNTYWTSWNGSLTWQNKLLLAGYLLLIAAGVGAAWKRLRWAGILPLLFNISYALSCGVGRISGWRYILPVDWVGYFYFALGVMEVLAGLALLFGANASRVFPEMLPRPPQAGPVSGRAAYWKFVLAGAFFLFVGSLPLILERAIPSHFGNLPTDALIQQVADLGGADPGSLQQFASQSDAVIMAGRLLYPRFYWANTGMASAHPWPAYITRDYSRMGFILVNAQGSPQAVLPVRDGPLLPFPNDRDVIILGCQSTDYVDVRLVLFVDGKILYTGGDPLTQPCAER